MEQAVVEPRSTGRLGWLLLFTWTLLALILDVFWIDLADRLWVIALIFPLALWSGLAGMAIPVAVRGIRRRPRAATFGLLLALIVAGFAQASFGGQLGILTRFYALRPKYQAIVKALETGAAPPGGLRHIVDNGPPLRVAFPWPGGIGDNWCGIVYDPSGLVMKAREIKPDLSNFSDPAFHNVRMLFGGDLRSCEPLGGPWYFCCFT
jgi:hypothetical protein